MDQGNGFYKSRHGFSALEKEEVWDCWASGESLKAIGRAFCKPSSSIHYLVSPCGGISPAPRRERTARRRSLPGKSGRCGLGA